MHPLIQIFALEPIALWAHFLLSREIWETLEQSARDSWLHSAVCSTYSAQISAMFHPWVLQLKRAISYSLHSQECLSRWLSNHVLLGVVYSLPLMLDTTAVSGVWTVSVTPLSHSRSCYGTSVTPLSQVGLEPGSPSWEADALS